MFFYSHPLTSLLQNNLHRNRNLSNNYKNNFTEKIMSKTNLYVGVCYTTLLGVTFMICMTFIVRAHLNLISNMITPYHNTHITTPYHDMGHMGDQWSVTNGQQYM